MNKENIIFLTLSFIAVLCIMGIGVAVAERSLLIAVVSVIGIIVSMSLGFGLRKKNDNMQKESR